MLATNYARSRARRSRQVGGPRLWGRDVFVQSPERTPTDRPLIECACRHEGKPVQDLVDFRNLVSRHAKDVGRAVCRPSAGWLCAALQALRVMSCDAAELTHGRNGQASPSEDLLRSLVSATMVWGEARHV